MNRDSLDALADLQKKAKSDTRTVMVITILTVLYLPANFAATLMGSKTVAFKPEGASFGDGTVLPTGDFWLGALIALLLGLVTATIWGVAERRRFVGWASKLRPVKVERSAGRMGGSSNYGKR